MTFPIVFGWIAFILTLASTFTCHMVDVKGADTFNQLRGFGPWTVQGQLPLLINGMTFDTGSNLDLHNMTWQSVESSVMNGIDNFLNTHEVTISTADSGKCYSWSQFHAAKGDLFDTEVSLARGFSMAAVIVGFVLAVQLLFLACCQIRSFGWVGFTFVLEGVLTALSLLMHQSFYCKDADTCTLGHSGILCIVATVIWVLTGIFLWCMPPTLRNSAGVVSPDQDKF